MILFVVEEGPGEGLELGLTDLMSATTDHSDEQSDGSSNSGEVSSFSQLLKNFSGHFK